MSHSPSMIGGSEGEGGQTGRLRWKGFVSTVVRWSTEFWKTTRGSRHPTSGGRRRHQCRDVRSGWMGRVNGERD